MWKKRHTLLSLVIVLIVGLIAGTLFVNRRFLLFELTFNPLNVETNAQIDHDQLLFQQRNQYVQIAEVPANKTLLLIVNVSGFSLVDDQQDDAISNFNLQLSQRSIGFDVNALGEHHLRFFVRKQENLVLIFKDFVKVELFGLSYGIYVDHIKLYQQGI
jgi:hypothetical protein